MSSRMSVTNIKALKALYCEQIDKEYQITTNRIENEETKLKHKIMSDFKATFRNDPAVNFKETEYDTYTKIHTDGRVDVQCKYIASKQIPYSAAGKNIKDALVAACQARKRRIADLDEWEIAALKAPTVEDVPEFDVTVVPPVFECA